MMALMGALVALPAILATTPLPTNAGKAGIGQPSDVLVAYEKVSQALANDDLAAAKTAAATLSEKAGEDGKQTIAGHADALAKSDSLDAAREHFKAMSGEAAKLAQGSTHHVVHCPMANANWVQSGDKIMNPYLGKKMQQCGSIIKD
jgi:hypothetical protein